MLIPRGSGSNVCELIVIGIMVALVLRFVL
jgi:hypothetical protein